MDIETKKKFDEEKDNLEDTFKCYSLHCGGIVYFSDGVPDDLKININNEKCLSQIHLNKKDVANNKQFKIDILASRALSQLYEANNFKNIDIENTPYDKNIYNMLSSGNNIGITLGESPLIRKAFMSIKPKSIEDIAICLSIIRPAASKNKTSDEKFNNNLSDYLIYDDDAIDIIANFSECSLEEADNYRRGFAKNDPKLI